MAEPEPEEPANTTAEKSESLADELSGLNEPDAGTFDEKKNEVADGTDKKEIENHSEKVVQPQKAEPQQEPKKQLKAEEDLSQKIQSKEHVDNTKQAQEEEKKQAVIPDNPVESVVESKAEQQESVETEVPQQTKTLEKQPEKNTIIESSEKVPDNKIEQPQQPNQPSSVNVVSEQKDVKSQELSQHKSSSIQVQEKQVIDDQPVQKFQPQQIQKSKEVVAQQVQSEEKPAQSQLTTEKVAEKEAEKSKEQVQPKKRRKRVFKDKQKQKQELPTQSSVPQQSASEAQPAQPASQPAAPDQRIHAVLEQVQHYTHQDDMRILSDTSFSKKKQNYIQLREWSRLRSQHMALHLNIVDELQTELEKIMKASMDNLQMYSSFFRERANQQDKYASHPIINTHFTTMSNDLSKDIYINCSRLLNSLADENLQRCKRSQSLALFIRKNILIDNVEDHIKRTHIETLKVREKVSTSRHALLRCRDDIDKRIMKMATRYNQYVTQFNHNPNKDFLKTQLSYLRKTYEQSQIQRKLGEFVYEYLKMAADEEIKRAEVIKKSIRLYTDAMKEAYGIKADLDGLQQLDKEEELKLIPEFYAVEELVDPKFADLLKKNLKIDGQLTMAELKEYLFSLKPYNFNSRILILKEYPVVNDVAKDRQEPGRLLVTVDSFIHLFFDSENTTPFCKPSLSIKIDKTLSIKTNRDLVVELSRKEEKKNVLSYFIWSKKSESTVSVRFLKRDALEEFEEFVIKLI